MDTGNAIILFYLFFSNLPVILKVGLIVTIYFTFLVFFIKIFVAYTIMKDEHISFRQAWKRLS